MIQHRLTLLALGVLSSVLFLPPIADAQDDFYALYNRYQFHQIGVSARSVGMGGVYSALTGGDMSLLGNPASLGFQDQRYVMFQTDLGDLSSDISAEDPFTGIGQAKKSDADMLALGGGLAYPFEWGGLGLYYDYRDDDVDYNSFRMSTGSLKQSGDLQRHAISFGGGYRVREDISIGYRYTYMDGDMDTVGSLDGLIPLSFSVNEDFEGHRNHFGVQYKANEMLMFGLDGIYGFGDRDVKNVFTMGGTTTDKGDSDADSWFVRGGVAWQAEQIPLLLAMDLKFENRELRGGLMDVDEYLWGMHLGAEYEVYENLFLRAGYTFEEYDFQDRPAEINESPTIGSYSAGLGYRYEQFSIDYGFIWSDTGASGDFTHVIGVGFHF
ncbi:MAG: hypothetical protein C4527_06165 [Candidatus Omnitrophota bacterium]|jgi:hypothetical protein|nr:MAG: hypothetical protein C4527_06165 [Candidatus Omnitrophota bacterium]